MQEMSDPVLVDCPDCAKSTLKKLISPVAFRLKGTGWYETDFKNSQKSKDTSNQPEANGSEADKNSKTEDEPSSKSAKNTEDGGSTKSLDSSERSDSPKA